MRIVILVLLVSAMSCKVGHINSKKLFQHEISFYNLTNGDTIVDVGCGFGTFSAKLAEFYPASYFILEDIDDTKISGLRSDMEKHKTGLAKYIYSRHSVIKGRADYIPLPSASQKQVICRFVLHECTRPAVLFAEISRILKPGGKLIMVEQEPNGDGDKEPSCKKLLIPAHTIEMLARSQQDLVFKKLSLTKRGIQGTYKISVLTFQKSDYSPISSTLN